MVVKGAEETGQGEIMLVPLATTSAELKGRVSGSQKPPFHRVFRHILVYLWGNDSSVISFFSQAALKSQIHYPVSVSHLVSDKVITKEDEGDVGKLCVTRSRTTTQSRRNNPIWRLRRALKNSMIGFQRKESLQGSWRARCRTKMWHIGGWIHADKWPMWLNEEKRVTFKVATGIQRAGGAS